MQNAKCKMAEGEAEKREAERRERRRERGERDGRGMMVRGEGVVIR
jgi:hypothetical protein